MRRTTSTIQGRPTPTFSEWHRPILRGRLPCRCEVAAALRMWPQDVPAAVPTTNETPMQAAHCSMHSTPAPPSFLRAMLFAMQRC